MFEHTARTDAGDYYLRGVPNDSIQKTSDMAVMIAIPVPARVSENRLMYLPDVPVENLRSDENGCQYVILRDLQNPENKRFPAVVFRDGCFRNFDFTSAYIRDEYVTGKRLMDAQRVQRTVDAAGILENHVVLHGVSWESIHYPRRGVIDPSMCYLTVKCTYAGVPNCALRIPVGVIDIHPYDGRVSSIENWNFCNINLGTAETVYDVHIRMCGKTKWAPHQMTAADVHDMYVENNTTIAEWGLLPNERMIENG